MKTLLATLLLILIGNIGFSQSNRDFMRLKNQLSAAKNDSSRISLMTEIGNVYRSTNQDSALFYAEQAISLAKQNKFTFMEIWATAVKGAVFHDLGNLPKALEIEFQALKLAEDSKLGIDKIGPIVFIGRIYTTLKDYPKALYYAQLENDLVIHEDSKIYAKENLANIFEQMNQLDSALFYIQLADKERINVRSVRSSSHRVFGNIYAKLGNDSLALDYYRKGIIYASKNNNQYQAALTFIDAAKLYKKENKTDSSIYYAKRSLETAQLISFKKGIFEASTLLSQLYDNKDTKEAFHYYKLATTTKDSLFGAGNMQALQAMIAQEEARQKEIETTKITYQNQLKQYALLAGLALLLILALFLYRNNEKEKKAKNLLHEKNEEIEATLSKLKATQAQLIQSEKLASLGELTAGIAHEIQNPLNFVNNFSELSVDLVKDLKEEIDKPAQDKDYIGELFDDLTQNQEKINHHGKRASSIVKGMLEHSRASTGEMELTDINKLADEYLRLSYHGMRAKDKSFNADYKTEFQDPLSKIEIIPQDIGRVLLNLINNAFYAVHQRQKAPLPPKGEYIPTVTVSTRLVTPPLGVGGLLEIRVKDNGNGIPDNIKQKIFQPFFTTKPTGEGTGLGLSLAYDIVTKGHGGTLEVETKENEGTVFVVKLPIGFSS